MKIIITGLIAGLSGLIFGIGLIIAGMANPEKVLAFLDLTGAWDPSLALVMAGAIAVAIIPFTLARQRELAMIGEPIQMPSNERIDQRLVIGSLLFGIGWGIAGICPGPAIVLLGTGLYEGFIFFGAMIMGMLLGLFVLKKINPQVE